ncbi:tyrosinase cofactor [Kitasatospora sp. GP82]|uniref:apotyrosinase chaperone MelC1 n=1 Tax=Kitasatospora sp. GP82 TaxID=3035089 RepID=UPI0024772C14|nr:tyrosinase cofactor [Kitasatospora sp. GP82]
MPDRGSSSELTRRRMLQGAGVALTAAVGTAVIGFTGPNGQSAVAADPGAGDGFDEVYQGRRIQGRPLAAGHGSDHSGHHGGGYQVLVDGQELHVMRNADGTWISVVNHYQTHATPRSLARAAVLDLQGAELLPLT